MRSSWIVCLVALAAHALLASARCASPACTSCPTSQDCANFEGCVDKSPGDYDAAYCVEGERVGEVEEDPEPCNGSLVMGAIGGVFAFMLPCCLLCNRRIQQHSRWMLTAPESSVKRATAGVTGNWTKTSGGEHPSTTYYLQVEFQAARSNGAMFNVGAEMMVQDATYTKALEARQLQVAYVVESERNFEAISDLEIKGDAKSFVNRVLAAAAVCFGTVGLALGVASGPAMGCYVGYAPLVVLILAGFVVGQFVIFPLLRAMSKALANITVTPSSSSAANVLGASA